MGKQHKKGGTLNTQDSKLAGRENGNCYSGTDLKNSLLRGRRFPRGRKYLETLEKKLILSELWRREKLNDKGRKDIFSLSFLDLAISLFTKVAKEMISGR